MMDTDTVSGWFILNAGFKVQGQCPACHSHRLAYYNTRAPGLKGITKSSKGIAPACMDCGKGLPSQAVKDKKSTRVVVLNHQVA